LSHYVVEPGQGRSKAIELAQRIAENAPISNFLMLNAIGMIDTMPPEAGLFTEAVAQALTLTTGDAQSGIDAFLEKRDVTF
jgi:enoyl-CoA hydratase/carnithine racemase